MLLVRAPQPFTLQQCANFFRTTAISSQGKQCSRLSRKASVTTEGAGGHSRPTDETDPRGHAASSF